MRGEKSGSSGVSYLNNKVQIPPIER